MIDEREILKYNMEMTEHATGAAQFMESLIEKTRLVKQWTSFLCQQNEILRVAIMRLDRKRMLRCVAKSF